MLIIFLESLYKNFRFLHSIFKINKIKFSFICLSIIFNINSKGNNCDSLIQTLYLSGFYSTSYINESDNIRNGPYYDGATIYFPIDYNSQLASIILAPGFMNSETTIQNWGPFLASYGIVTMTIGTNSLLETPSQRKDALIDAMISLKQENNRYESPLYNNLDTNSIAVGGFSMGGGGAQLAAVQDSSINAVIALHPFLENATESTLNHKSPVLIVSGQFDLIANPSQHANNHFQVTPEETPKQRYEVQYANHDVISGPNGGNGEVGIRVLAWLQSFLKKQYCFCPELQLIPNTASDFDNNVICSEIFILGCTDSISCNYNSEANINDNSCFYNETYYDCDGNCVNDSDNDGICDELEIISFNCINDICVDPSNGTGIYSSLNDCEKTCENISSIENNEFDLKIYPNPSNGNFIIDFKKREFIYLTITNILGEVVFNQEYEKHKTIDIRMNTKGIHIISIHTNNQNIKRKIFLN